MALRDQPYLPLYIQDFMTDEKLIECSAETTGVYIRLMCILHKSEEYGKLLLKQKDKQTDKPMVNFALKIARQMPYSVEVVTRSINELLAENVLVIEGDFLVQKRMVKDNLLSLVRAEAGKKGGKFAQAKPKAKVKANTENEIVNENEIEDKTVNAKKTKLEIFEQLFSDELWVEQTTMTHKGKDLKQAWEECWNHHSVGPSPPREVWEWKQKMNTWLTIKPTERKNGKGTPKQFDKDKLTEILRERGHIT